MKNPKFEDFTILALDCATKTGWAIVKDGKIYESGVQDFSKRRGESNGAMFLKFRRWLKNLLDEDVNLVIYEQSHHRGGAATEIGVNLTGRVQEACAEGEVEYVSTHTATLKKWACGHGKASKEDMIKAVFRRVGIKTASDDEADAILLGMMAWELYGC